MYICQICLKQYSYKDKFEKHIEQCVEKKRSLSSERGGRTQSYTHSVDEHSYASSPEIIDYKRRSTPREIVEKTNRNSPAVRDVSSRDVSSRDIPSRTSSPSVRIERRYASLDELEDNTRQTNPEITPPPTRIVINTTAPSTEDIINRTRKLHTEMKIKYQEVVDELKVKTDLINSLEKQLKEKIEELSLVRSNALKITSLFKTTLLKQKEDCEKAHSINKLEELTREYNTIMLKNTELEKQKYDNELLKVQFTSILESTKNKYENDISILKQEIIALKQQ